jgi:hypothetical protein
MCISQCLQRNISTDVCCKENLLKMSCFQVSDITLHIPMSSSAAICRRWGATVRITLRSMPCRSLALQLAQQRLTSCRYLYWSIISSSLCALPFFPRLAARKISPAICTPRPRGEWRRIQDSFHCPRHEHNIWDRICCGWLCKRAMLRYHNRTSSKQHAPS